MTFFTDNTDYSGDHLITMDEENTDYEEEDMDSEDLDDAEEEGSDNEEM